MMLSFIFAIVLLQTIEAGIVTEIKSNQVTFLKDAIKLPGSSSRVRREVPTLTKAQKREIVGLHNKLRRQEGASNMEEMKWNEYLADMAQDWAENCVWAHGQPTRPQEELPFKQLGQNLYMSLFSNPSYKTGIQRWYDEKPGYDYDKDVCDKEPCGHYTQVVWASSSEVGCGIHVCDSLNGRSNAYYLVCNYGPPGNYDKQKPYMLGDSCSQCPSYKPHCRKDLCTDVKPPCEGKKCAKNEPKKKSKKQKKQKKQKKSKKASKSKKNKKSNAKKGK